jgi:hypothetical protein
MAPRRCSIAEQLLPSALGVRRRGLPVDLDPLPGISTEARNPSKLAVLAASTSAWPASGRGPHRVITGVGDRRRHSSARCCTSLQRRADAVVAVRRRSIARSRRQLALRGQPVVYGSRLPSGR